MQNVRHSARISEVTQRRHQAVAAPELKPPFHPTRATARPHDADSPFMEEPAKTMRTTADRGVTTREYEDDAALAYDVCVNVADIITIYVDDILVCTDTDEEVDAIFNHMQAHILLSDMGPVAKLLGMEIVHAVTQLSLHLTQPHQLHVHMARRVVAYLLHTKT
ncbi:hypothetical protein B5M09_013044, partial [Aphanomyces astaci]